MDEWETTVYISSATKVNVCFRSWCSPKHIQVILTELADQKTLIWVIMEGKHCHLDVGIIIFRYIYSPCHDWQLCLFCFWAASSWGDRSFRGRVGWTESDHFLSQRHDQSCCCRPAHRAAGQTERQVRQSQTHTQTSPKRYDHEGQVVEIIESTTKAVFSAEVKCF